MTENTTTDPPAPDLELNCPTCGAPMEVIERFTLPGAPEDVEHLKVQCIVGHWFTPTTESLVEADRDGRPAKVVTK
jgi:hypothetical protein